MIALEHLTYRYPGQKEPVLADLSLTVERGERLLVAGPSGSGKSSLLRTLNGLVPHFHGGTIAGRVRVAGRDPVALGPRGMSDAVGFVIQDPEAHFVAQIVEDELAFVLENHGVPPAEMRCRIGETLERLSIEPLRKRRIDTLSGGERQRVAIASVLTARPEVLVLDEPTSQLDPLSAREVLQTLEDLHRELGLTLVISEHRLERLADFADGVLLIDRNEPTHCTTPNRALADSPLAPPVTRLGAALGWRPPPLTVGEARQRAELEVLRESLAEPSPTPPAEPSVDTDSEPALIVQGVGFTYPDGPEALDSVDLEVRRGEILALLGRNGAGKSTLLKILVGLLRPDHGSVRLHGPDGEIDPGAQELATVTRSAAFVPQNPARLLFHERVDEELRHSLKLHDLPSSDLPRHLAEFGLTGLEASWPRDLSTGERQRLALAVMLTAAPPILLLDEPTRGLDAPNKERLAAHLEHLRERGTAIVLATHDVELVARTATRAALLEKGRRIDAGPTAAVLARHEEFAPQILRLLNDQRWLSAEDVQRELGRRESAS